MTANDKYPVLDSEILTSPIKMELSLKSKTFNDSLVRFLQSTSNFNHFEKNFIVIATFFWKLLAMKDLIKPVSKKYRFRRPFESQHVKGCQTLAKSA